MRAEKKVVGAKMLVADVRGDEGEGSGAGDEGDGEGDGGGEERKACLLEDGPHGCDGDRARRVIDWLRKLRGGSGRQGLLGCCQQEVSLFGVFDVGESSPSHPPQVYGCQWDSVFVWCTWMLVVCFFLLG